MRIYLVRHGDAVPEEDAGSDRDRWLSPRGREHARILGRLLREQNVAPDAIVASPPPGEAQLLAAIHAHPGDDELRRVYADLLLERGDPRGELIVLQLRRAAGEASEREMEQERALLKRYAKAWLGPLARVIELGAAMSGA